jgi:hypothetical protein
MNLDDDTIAAAEAVSAACELLLHGKGPLVQSAALLNLHAKYLSGFAFEMRPELLKMHVDAVLLLAQVEWELRNDANANRH